MNLKYGTASRPSYLPVWFEHRMIKYGIPNCSGSICSERGSLHIIITMAASGIDFSTFIDERIKLSFSRLKETTNTKTMVYIRQNKSVLFWLLLSCNIMKVGCDFYNFFLHGHVQN